jgi:hypothetical protein
VNRFLPVLLVLSLVLCGTSGLAQPQGAVKSTATPLQTKCPKCNHENRPSAKFCVHCGTALNPAACPRCQAGIGPDEKFCSQCGLDLVKAKNPIEATPEAPKVTQEPGLMEPRYPSLTVGGFGDTTFSGTGRGTSRYFTIGQQVLHFTSALGPKTHSFAELSFTPRSDAGTGTPPATGYNAEVERAIVRLDHSDQLKFSFGRYHTPINWWNTAFHHGLWLQTSISRPEMARFGGQFIPVHFIGALVEGALPTGGLNLNYNVGVGNGRGNVVSRGGDAGDANSELAWLVNLYARPDQVYGLQLGGSLYQDKIVLPNGGPQYRETIISGHVVLQKETPEVIAEYAHVDHKQVGGPTLKSEGYYIQLAYRLPGLYRTLKPYFRYEKMGIPTGEPIFTSVPCLRGSLFGVRYDIADYVALKAEYRDFRRRPGPSITGWFGQVSYAF